MSHNLKFWLDATRPINTLAGNGHTKCYIMVNIQLIVCSNSAKKHHKNTKQ